jgi:hypothetical protein
MGSASASQCRAYDVHDGEFDIAYCRFARGPPSRRTGGWRSVDTDHDALDVDVSFFGGRHRPDRLACATGRLVAGEKVVRALGHHELRVKRSACGAGSERGCWVAWVVNCSVPAPRMEVPCGLKAITR